MKKTILIIIEFIFISAVCLFAQKIEISPLNINSYYDDFGTSLSNHGRILFFTSERDGYQKIYVCERTSGGWSEPVELNDFINSGKQNGTIGITPDGQYMIFASYKHYIKGFGRTDLYSAHKSNGIWSDIQNLGEIINSEYWDSQPFLSSDGNTLFFVSDRPGGYGGTDIYMSKWTGRNWGKPLNLGPTINTEYDEMAPVIASDNKTFTFASNRPGGYGGFDIYVSKFNSGSFNNPQIAVAPINSNADEYFLYPLPNSDYAYFTSNRSRAEGALDLFMAVPNPYKSDAVVLVQGAVKDVNTKQPLESKITITDLRTGKKEADFQSDGTTGNYYVVLQPGRTYSLTASKDGYLFYSERFEIPLSEKGHEETKDIYLSPIKEGNTRLLIFFDFDKADLKEESIPELERVIEFLRENPDVKIAIEGHTDDVGSDEYNNSLSLNRANAVKKYIVDAGIDSKRIKTEGYGKRKPLMQGTTDEARSKNRRVEMRILK